MAPASAFTPNERLLRKRLAARLRQRRCRQRKREAAAAAKKAAAEKQSPKSTREIADLKVDKMAKGTAQPPFDPHGQYGNWVPYPMMHHSMPLPPRGQSVAPLPPQQQQQQHHHHPSYAPSHAPHHYYAPPHQPPMMPVLGPQSHGAPYIIPMRASQDPYCMQPQQPPQQPALVSRTISHSPSDTFFETKTVIKKKRSRKPKPSLLSTEKAAVAAMLSLKSSSSDEESSVASLQPVAFDLPVNAGVPV